MVKYHVSLFPCFAEPLRWKIEVFLLQLDGACRMCVRQWWMGCFLVGRGTINVLKHSLQYIVCKWRTDAWWPWKNLVMFICSEQAQNRQMWGRLLQLAIRRDEEVDNLWARAPSLVATSSHTSTSRQSTIPPTCEAGQPPVLLLLPYYKPSSCVNVQGQFNVNLSVCLSSSSLELVQGKNIMSLIFPVLLTHFDER